MNYIKKHLVFAIGLAVLILVALVFFATMKAENLEDGDMRNWTGASESRRIAAVKILTGGEENTDIMVACLNKISSLPDSGKTKVKDAASLCLTGILLKDSL
ncbi:MAG: hypothetical protein FWC61_03315 [Proteobacteria bacterium]|nr:hypothetical protein [Pseudomonadota bacterium]